MKRISVIFSLVIIVIMLVLAGCSGAPAPAPAPAPATTYAPAPAPAPSITSAPALAVPPALSTTVVPPPPAAEGPTGKIVVAITNLGREMGVAMFGGSMGAQYWMPAYDTLLRLDKDTFKPGPWMAKSFTMSDDAKVFNFVLERGIMFHGDWGEFTAEDVKFTLELAMSPDSYAGPKTVLNQKLDRIEINSKYELTVYFNEGHWSFIDDMADVQPHMGIVSKKHIETVGLAIANRNPIGTGPFVFTEHKMGESISFRANMKYWNGAPPLAEIVMLNVPDIATQIAMLQTGEVDLVKLNYEFEAEAKAGGATIITMPNARSLHLCLYGQYYAEETEGYDPTVVWALPDREAARKVRLALSHAINRQEIVDYVLNGHGSIADSGCPAFWPETPGFNPAWQPDPYDQAKAKALFAEAGYDDLSKVKITMEITPMGSTPFNEKINEAVALYWQDLGIDVTMRKRDFASFQAGYINRVTAGPTGGYAWVYPGPYRQWAVIGYNACATTWGRYCMFGEYPEFDRIIGEAMAEPNIVTRTALAREMGDFVYDNRIIIGLGFSDQLWATTPGLVWDSLPGGPSQGYLNNFDKMYWAD